MGDTRRAGVDALPRRGELNGLEGVFAYGREDAARCRISEGRAADDHALRGVQRQPEDSLQVDRPLPKRRSDWARGPVSCAAPTPPAPRAHGRGSPADGAARPPTLGVA